MTVPLTMRDPVHLQELSTATARPIAIVNSGAYAEPELAAEFGMLPPAFLPVGHGRLYELQARALAPLGAELYLTLPESFVLAPWEHDRVAATGFAILRTPDGAGLGPAILAALGRIGFNDRPLRILHGDTVVEDIDLFADDIAAVDHGGDGYRWAQVALDVDRNVTSVTGPGGAPSAGPAPRLCGYFAFASAARFAEKLAMAHGDFFAALGRHAASPGLQAIRPRRWLDFGHVQTFFQSRRVVTTERAFNSLRITDTNVRKRSVDARKLEAEAR